MWLLSSEMCRIAFEYVLKGKNQNNKKQTKKVASLLYCIAIDRQGHTKSCKSDPSLLKPCVFFYVFESKYRKYVGILMESPLEKKVNKIICNKMAEDEEKGNTVSYYKLSCKNSTLKTTSKSDIYKIKT